MQFAWARAADVVYLAKVRIFWQITTEGNRSYQRTRCRLPCKGTNFLANHNNSWHLDMTHLDVVYLAKVRIFWQITTFIYSFDKTGEMSFTLQRYEFFGKSQQWLIICRSGGDVVYLAKVRIFWQITTNRLDYQNLIGCRLPCKGTNFLANHNHLLRVVILPSDVVYLAKVRIFWQITTYIALWIQRTGCRLPCKGTNFLANHNVVVSILIGRIDVVYLAKVRIF